MSTFQLPEAVHVSQGNDEFDFTEGSIAAGDFREEQILTGLVASGHAELVEASDPPTPVPETIAEDPGQPDPPAGDPPAGDPPVGDFPDGSGTQPTEPNLTPEA